MASGSVRGPVLVPDDAFTIVYIHYIEYSRVICIGVFVQRGETKCEVQLGCSELMN
jgi:hypothetical protein